MSIEKEWEGRMPVYIPTCDMCGKQLLGTYDFYDAVREKKNAGWKSKNIDGLWVDICEDCKWDESTFNRLYERKEE